MVAIGNRLGNVYRPIRGATRCFSQEKMSCAEPKRWPIWKITLLLYPLGFGAAAINIFFVGLLGQAVGWPAFTPTLSIIAGAVIGVPFTWLFARHIYKLIGQADSSTKL